MTAFEQMVTSLAAFGLILSGIITYLKINKIWTRKHIGDVAESVSVAAVLLSLFATLPFLIKFAVVDRDLLGTGKFALSLTALFVFFLVGIGYWVPGRKRFSLWRKIATALRSEGRELDYLIRTFAKPREADTILRLLQLVSVVDEELDEREIAVLDAVARPWGIHPSEVLERSATETAADITQVRDAFLEYIEMRPPIEQVAKVFDLLGFLVRADKRVTREEEVILDELSYVVQSYLDKDYDGAGVHEVLVVPQNPEQDTAIRDVVPRARLADRAGGQAFIAGAYFSRLFALEMRDRYRSMNFFCTVEIGDKGAKPARTVER